MVVKALKRKWNNLLSTEWELNLATMLFIPPFFPIAINVAMSYFRLGKLLTALQPRSVLIEFEDFFGVRSDPVLLGPLW